MAVVPTGDPSATCWKEGCDQVRANLGTYYCEPHNKERRDRIAMAIADAIAGVTEAAQEATKKITTFAEAIQHRVAVGGEYSEWRWSCSCGKGSLTPAPTEATAKAASRRHLRAVSN